MTATLSHPETAVTSADEAATPEATATETTPTAEETAQVASQVRVTRGKLSDAELAAVAVVVSAMSVTSRLEAEERMLAEGSPESSAWNDPVHQLPRSHSLRSRPGPGAWQFSDR